MKLNVKDPYKVADMTKDIYNIGKTKLHLCKKCVFATTDISWCESKKTDIKPGTPVQKCFLFKLKEKQT